MSRPPVKRDRHPLSGRVPGIDDAGCVLADPNAIRVQLAERHGAGAWLPENARGAVGPRAAARTAPTTLGA